MCHLISNGLGAIMKLNKLSKNKCPKRIAQRNSKNTRLRKSWISDFINLAWSIRLNGRNGQNQIALGNHYATWSQCCRWLKSLRTRDQKKRKFHQNSNFQKIPLMMSEMIRWKNLDLEKRSSRRKRSVKFFHHRKRTQRRSHRQQLQ